MVNKPQQPGQGQKPMASRTQPEALEHTPETEEQELAAAHKGGDMPDHGGHKGPMSTGDPSGRTAGREE